MAAVTTSTKSYTDDLATDESGERTNPSLPAGQRVGITLTDGQAVWVLDTARTNELVATLKAAGTKQKRRGRKSAS